MKSRIILVLGLIILVLGLISFHGCEREKKLVRSVKQYERNIAALNDSVKVIIKDKNSVTFGEAAVVGDIKDITKSAAFKQLTEEKQRFYLDLVHTKGLLAAAEIQLSKKDSIKETKDVTNISTSKGDSITFKKGSIVNYCEDDTAKRLKWFADITVQNPFVFNFNYQYDLKINTEFKTNKDKSVVVNYKVNDPELKAISANSFTIPFEDQRTKWEKFMDKTYKVGFFVLPPAAFIGGLYLANRLR